MNGLNRRIMAEYKSGLVKQVLLVEAMQRQKQKRIAIMSNAGGTGKSTLAINIAYQLARLGKTVCLIGCDPNGSLTLFAGLEDPPESKLTLDRVLDFEFDGRWPLFSVWRDRISGVDACLGGLPLVKTAKRLEHDSKGVSRLTYALEDYPLPHDILIFDCPGTIELFHEVTLTASTHLLIVIQPEDKDIDAMGKLLAWIYESRRRLRLKPAPRILGVVPNRYRKDRAMHRDNMGDAPEESLPSALEAMGIEQFPVIRDSAHVANASANGLPLGLWRSGEELNKIFEKIASAVVAAEINR